jgi:phosphoglucosamine mutase
MSRKYFGTDGVRGCVGEAPITPDFCLRLGYAAGKTLVAREHLRPGDHPAVIIGKDTRISGYMLESCPGSRAFRRRVSTSTWPARCRRRPLPT